MWRGKNHVDLWPMVYDFDNLFAAMMEVSRGKRYKKEFQRFYNNWEENLIEIQNELIWKTYKPGEIISFVVHDPKTRMIDRPIIKDRVVHHAVIRVVKREFYQVLSSKSYACCDGKGELKACLDYSKAQRSALCEYGGTGFWIVSLDMHHYFASINHEMLNSLIKFVFSDDPDIIWLFSTIIGATETGIPIGFLTSQYEANLFGTALDFFAQRKLNVKYYIRYMDDIRILCTDKNTAKEIISSIDEFCTDTLHISLSGKKSYIHKFCGHDIFCGYNVHPHMLTQKKQTVERSERRILKKQQLFKEGKLTAQKLYKSARNLNVYLSHTAGCPTNKIADAAISLASDWMDDDDKA